MTRTERASASDVIAGFSWLRRGPVAVGVVLALTGVTAAGQTRAPKAGVPAGAAITAAAIPLVTPGDYIIGSDDVLSILFWNDKDLSAPEVTVRPDGKVTLPLLNDVQAAGRTPEQLRSAIKEAAQKYVEDPNPTVTVKEIKSRRVFITGQVDKPGTYPLTGPTTILQLIAIAGGLKDFADGKNISLVRNEAGQPVVHSFNYQDVLKVKNLRQNVELKPDDTVVVP